MLVPDFNYKFAFLVFFFVQGIIFSLLILMRSREDESSSGKWLAAFLLLGCMYITPWMLGNDNWYAVDGYREFLFFVPFYQFYLIGPVIYFYIRSLLSPEISFAQRDWIHFIPAVFYLMYSLVVFITDVLVLDEFYFYADGRDKDLSPWYQISGLAWMIFYSGLSLSRYQTYRKRIVDELSYADSVIFKWIRRFLFALLAIFCLRISFFIFLPEWGNFGTKWWYYFAFSIILWYISIEGYTHLIKLQRFPLGPLSPQSSKDPGLATQQSLTEKSIPESPPNVDELKRKLVLLMESQRLYENSALTLSDIATQLQVTSKTVSQVINQGFDMNFNDFVNQYRVKAIQERIIAGDQSQFTLLALALDSGFNSKATFNRVFKKITALTPLQFSKLNAPQKAVIEDKHGPKS